MSDHTITLTDEQVERLRAAATLWDFMELRDAVLAQVPEPMTEPTWPRAAVMAGCREYDEPHLHVLAADGYWTCADAGDLLWPDLTNPRPLTAAERAERGMPALMPKITDDLVKRMLDVFYDDDGSTPIAMRAVLEALATEATS